MTQRDESDTREVGQASGWSARARQGGWEWDAWHYAAHRCGAARTEMRARSAAQLALAELKSERRARLAGGHRR